jgi:tetratricopeptide (TPR) repeat protein
MEFSPFNKIVKLCLQGMNFEETGLPDEAYKTFLKAWNEATYDFEKFLAAYYIARHQITITDRLSWYETSLRIAFTINDNSVKSAYTALYTNIAKCYDELNDLNEAKKNYELAHSFSGTTFDNGPFYHGTKANLQVSDLLKPGYGSNYKAELVMNHIYFTALLNGAALAAALAKGEGHERVYLVEPTGVFENDPNVTDKKFPGNLTRSYRTHEPLKIIGEVADWEQQMPGEIQQFRERLANSEGKIIN